MIKLNGIEASGEFGLSRNSGLAEMQNIRKRTVENIKLKQEDKEQKF